MHSILLTELYTIAHMLEIKKQYWGKYQIMQKKLHQHKHYRMGETGKQEIGKYEKGKDGTNEH